jgi:hypothetical protein
LLKPAPRFRNSGRCMVDRWRFAPSRQRDAERYCSVVLQALRG